MFTDRNDLSPLAPTVTASYSKQRSRTAVNVGQLACVGRNETNLMNHTYLQ